MANESDAPVSSPTPWYQTAATAFIGPFVAFLVILTLVQQLGTEDASAPWWRQHPEHWGYPLQAILCIGLVIFWRKHYPRFSWKGSGLAVLMGIAGIAVWLLPPLIHAATGIGEGGSLPWLKWLGFQSRLDGFNPYLFGEETTALQLGLIVFLRFLRLVVAVSLVEEIFWRGFLMPFLSDPDGDWKERRLSDSTPQALGLTALAFALVHLGPDFAVALVYGALTGWVSIKTGNMWAAVIMHAVANLSLGLFIVVTQWWGLW